MTIMNIALISSCILPNMGSSIIKPPVIRNFASTIQYTATINEEDYINEDQVFQMALKDIGYAIKNVK